MCSTASLLRKRIYIFIKKKTVAKEGKSQVNSAICLSLTNKASGLRQCVFGSLNSAGCTIFTVSPGVFKDV